MGCSHSQHVAGGGDGFSSCNYSDYWDETLGKDASEDNTSDSSSEHEANVTFAENNFVVSDAANGGSTTMGPSATSVSVDAICCRPTAEDLPKQTFFAGLSSVMSQDFDMDEPHPPSPPFLGSSFSILGEETPPPDTSFPNMVKEEGGDGGISVISPVHNSHAKDENHMDRLSSAVEITIAPQASPLETFVQGETSSGTRLAHPPTVQSRVGLMPFHVTKPCPYTPKQQQSPNSGEGTSCFTIRTATTTSTNATPENSLEYGVSFNASVTNKDDASVTFMPRQLFVEDTTPTKRKEDVDLIIQNSVLLRGTTYTPSSSTTSLQPQSDYDDGDEKDVRRKTPLENAPLSRKRHINTLPSTQRGKPIRLRVTEAYGATNHSSLLDRCNASGDEHDSCSEPEEVYEPHHVSYDPYFSTGQYHITTPSCKPWGNGLSVKMGVQYMTLQDRDGHVLAVTRSRHTWIPSHVIYSPKPRFEGQIPSSHRPITDGANLGSQQGTVDLYPWALVRKEGRDMQHDATVHFAEKIKSNTVLTMNKGVGSFSPNPAFRSRHGFEGDGLHSHTVVSRIVSTDTKTREIPCCLIIRDPIDRDVFNVTIAPGVDPLLILCYLVVHSKMDVEPMMSG